MRSRCLLHKNKLEDFEKWLAAHGWVLEPAVGEWEILRARKPGKNGVLLVYDRLNVKEHYTVFGESMEAVHRFIHESKKVATYQLKEKINEDCN